MAKRYLVFQSKLDDEEPPMYGILNRRTGFVDCLCGCNGCFEQEDCEILIRRVGGSSIPIAAPDEDCGHDLTKRLSMLFPEIVKGKHDRIELRPVGLEPVVAERKGDMLALFHYVAGEIHECPYICINIDPETNKAHTVSYHVADAQWYKNVNDYIGDGRIKVQILLDNMTCEWLDEIIKRTRTKPKGRKHKIIKELMK